MNWFTSFLKSSIGRKVIMGLTGIFLIIFLMVHCGVNACIFVNDNGETFNKAAHFMGSNIFIRVAEIGLFAGILLHIVQGLLLWADKSKRRPIAYDKSAGNATSTWYSRSMGLLGTLILLFLVLHLAHFWVPSRITGLGEVMYDGEKVFDLYAEMKVVFAELWVVVVYVLGVGSLAYHLMHGFQSAFQSMGWNHPKYTPLIKSLGYGFSILIPLIFAAMPILMFLKVVN
ncbi:MAG: succinate dehydrogenase cytochrome b subunit [Saprospiraceae bacterium]